MNGAVLIRGRHVLTSATPESVTDGAVRLSAGRITHVGAYRELAARFPDDPVHGGPNDIVTPGFVNAHGHFSEALLAGMAEQYELDGWIRELIAPVAPHLRREDAYVGTLLAGIQMLRSGVTLVNDMFVCDPVGPEPVTPGVVQALDELGLRGVVAFGAGDARPGVEKAAVIREHEALEKAAAVSRLCRFRVGITVVAAQSPELFDQSVRMAVDGGHGAHIHLHEVREEAAGVRARHGLSAVEYCADRGLFDAPVLAAHCVWNSRRDLALLADHGVGVAHNPVANMVLGSGVCPLPELGALGVDVGIGVDGAASNDRQDMTEAVKTAVLLQRVHHLRASALSARDAFRMATIGGARALNMGAEVGSLEPGKAADVVVFDGESPALANVHDPVQSVVYCAGPREVKEVWVDGRPVVVGGEVTSVRTADAVARSREAAVSLVRRAGLADLSLLARV
ncbi:amidohydrolase [Streptomyces sp. CB00072]|uniref:amidohydrolase family protein n=1 Tax=Streptomyces sp. CB00072 TaxID=1703928 RepID=UPI00093DB9AD|nr:amidohydrolase [Streptomyces sp. CB00072]OKI51845.1 amidohydrolase [Streptomyces sp. CB00072]